MMQALAAGQVNSKEQMLAALSALAAAAAPAAPPPVTPTNTPQRRSRAEVDVSDSDETEPTMGCQVMVAKEYNKENHRPRARVRLSGKHIVETPQAGAAGSIQPHLVETPPLGTHGSTLPTIQNIENSETDALDDDGDALL
jgi:hypothetical protein